MGDSKVPPNSANTNYPSSYYPNGAWTGSASNSQYGNYNGYQSYSQYPQSNAYDQNQYASQQYYANYHYQNAPQTSSTGPSIDHASDHQSKVAPLSSSSYSTQTQATPSSTGYYANQPAGFEFSESTPMNSYYGNSVGENSNYSNAIQNGAMQNAKSYVGTDYQSSESPASSSPEHSASESSRTEGDTESADSDTLRSEHQMSLGPAIGSTNQSNLSSMRQNMRPNYPHQQYPSRPWSGHPNNSAQQNTYSSAQQPQNMPGAAQVQSYAPPGQPFPDPKLSGSFKNLSLNTANVNQQQQQQPVNLLSNRHILPSSPVTAVEPRAPAGYRELNCNPDIFRSTVTAVPLKEEDLMKAKLPFGLLIHPFRDLQNLPVIQSSVIVRCRNCRTYIHPFVSFPDQRHWKCNMCYRTNDLPAEFNVNPLTQKEGDVTSRPEVRNSTIEFIAPGDYMLRPPQAAIYVFVLDVSAIAVSTGYLKVVCQVLEDNLSVLPGDARTKLGILCHDSNLHFLALLESQSRAQLLTFPDVEDFELPRHEDLLVNVRENHDKICRLLRQLPSLFASNRSSQSALGCSLKAAQKLLAPTGGRITVFQAILPTKGPGKLTSREDPNERAAADIKNMQPANEFYKMLALECSGMQIAIDQFLISSQFIDIATLSGMSRFCGGCVSYFPSLFAGSSEMERLEEDFTRYVTRKIGFEAVMRVRCTKGLEVADFFGNFFVRSTDLLAFPNINPDAAVSMKVKIKDNITSNSVCFQAALLYTSSKGERRIRVHTLYLPIAQSPIEVVQSADVQAVACFLAQMAVSRSLESSIGDARDALVNAVVDSLAAFRSTLPGHANMGTVLVAPHSLSLFALFVLGILKCKAFRVGCSTKLDERLDCMVQLLTSPIFQIMHIIYPPMYPLHTITQHPTMTTEEGTSVPQPPVLHLSAESLARDGVYLLDRGNRMVMLVRRSVSMNWCVKVLDLGSPSGIPGGGLNVLPVLDNPLSAGVRNFIDHLLSKRPNHAPLLILRDDDQLTKPLFFECLVDDKSDTSSSYVEFLQHINGCIMRSK